MTKCLFKFALLAALVACGLWQSKDVRAAAVTLTSESVVMNCPGPGSGNAQINLAGPEFSLIFSYLARPEPDCAGAQQPLHPARFDAFSEAIFQGVRTFEMTGFLSFDETTLIGFVEGRDLHNPQNILFTVNFTGSGAGVITNTRSTFEVCPVPEPATLALLSVGFAAFGAARRYTNSRRLKSQT